MGFPGFSRLEFGIPKLGPPSKKRNARPEKVYSQARASNCYSKVRNSQPLATVTARSPSGKKSHSLGIATVDWLPPKLVDARTAATAPQPPETVPTPTANPQLGKPSPHHQNPPPSPKPVPAAPTPSTTSPEPSRTATTLPRNPKPKPETSPKPATRSPKPSPTHPKPSTRLQTRCASLRQRVAPLSHRPSSRCCGAQVGRSGRDMHQQSWSLVCTAYKFALHGLEPATKLLNAARIIRFSLPKQGTNGASPCISAPLAHFLSLETASLSRFAPPSKVAARPLQAPSESASGKPSARRLPMQRVEPRSEKPSRCKEACLLTRP